MIIKSMSRSSLSFAQLYDYLTRDADAELDCHNLYSSPHEREEVVDEFMKNAQNLKRSRGKNYLYHEIISLERSHLSQERQCEILKELSRYYLSRRAAEHLSFTALHKDKEHLHVHLMISANTVTGQKRVRLSKKDFAKVQQDAELFLNQRYPELKQQEHYQKESAAKPKRRRVEQEMKSRRKKSTKKDELISILTRLFETNTKPEQLKRALEARGIESYTRGKTHGVVFEGKKYRLKTLGVELEYNRFIQKARATEQREARRSEHKASKVRSRRQEMERVRKARQDDKDLEKER